MHIIAKSKPMTVRDAVQEIATAFAEAEKRDRQTLKAFRGLRPAIKSITESGVVGAGRAMALAAELDSIASRHKAEKLILHSQLTEEAKSLGIDMPPTIGEDPDDGEIVVFGGGDR